MISSSSNVLACSFPCVLRAISLEIHDLESELTLSQAGEDGHTELYGMTQGSPEEMCWDMI